MSQEAHEEFGNYNRSLEQTRLDMAKELFHERMMAVPAFAELLDVHLQTSSDYSRVAYPNPTEVTIEPYIVMPEQPVGLDPRMDAAVAERITGVKVTRNYYDEALGVTIGVTDDLPIFVAYRNTNFGDVTADTLRSKAGRVAIERKNRQTAMVSLATGLIAMPDDYDEAGAPLVNTTFSVLTEAQKVDAEVTGAFLAAYAELFETVGTTTVLDPATGTVIVP